MKTLSGCIKSKLPFSQYLQVGDSVDESICDYFIEVLPPATMNKSAIQMGEPYNHNEKWQAQYLTLEKIKGLWTYTGIKPVIK